MPRPSINATKCHINLYTEDMKFLRSKCGSGWTGEVREIIHRYCDNMKSLAKQNKTVEQIISEFVDGK